MATHEGGGGLTFAGREKADHSPKLCRETQSCEGAAGRHRHSPSSWKKACQRNQLWEAGGQEARRLGSFRAVRVPFENAQATGSKRNCFGKLKAAARAAGGARGGRQGRSTWFIRLGGDLQSSKYLCMETGWVLNSRIRGGMFFFFFEVESFP